MSTAEFHRNLKVKGKGAKDWANSWTEVEYLGNGKFAANLSVGHRVFKDKSDDKWKRHKLTDERPAKDYVLIQSAKCCVEVYPYYAKYFDVNHEEVRLYEERWIVQRLFKEPDTWRDVDAYNPVVTVEEYSEPAGDVVKVTVTYDTDYGVLTVEYFQRDGNALKHNVTFKNTSGATETFRVLQRWAGIVGTKCNGKDIPVMEDASFFAFHKADKPARKFNIAENLWSMIFNPDGSEKTDQCLQRPVSVETHAQGMKGDFIYAQWVLAQDESLEVDPDSATLSNPTVDRDCSSPAGFGTPDADYLRAGGYHLAGSHKRLRMAIEWNVSGIPVGSTITDTVFKYNGMSNNADCHIHECRGKQPSIDSEADVYAEAGEGTVYADPVGFPVVAVNQSEDLGAAADTDLAAQLPAGWFAIGIQSEGEDTDYTYTEIFSEEKAGVTPPPTLYVEYTPPVVGWTGKISGVTDPAKVMGVAVANIAKVKGVA